MSSQRGNTSRSRGQKYQNTIAFKNDKYGASVQVKKANSKIHDGLCQHCKDVLEWKVKYNKYKSLTQPRKCVKCSQKTVKDAYHVICKPCSLQLEICCKCGKKEDIVIPVNSHLDQKEEDTGSKNKGKKCTKDIENLDSDDDFDDDDHHHHEKEDFSDLEDKEDEDS
ncbi:uncharacterized protein C9orf85 homolog [Hippocampus comes]|uniref:Chromosome 9 open reading frame 85 n=1 Tax=Hippocampus comes TaxID=109280 RepID=A0A3Q3DKB9_HIPCM|nr:PREDICTED: uncharacterized protein C9orf85 homolog [Hippocampus comes]